MALDLALVLGRDEQGHLDVGQLDLFDGQAEEVGRLLVFLGGHFPVGDEVAFDLEVAGVGHPGEVVDHGLAEGERLLPGRSVDPGVGLLARRTDDETLGHGDVDDEVGEVGEELGVLMVGMAFQPFPSS